MTMALVGLLVLFALVPSGFSLSCIKCIHSSSTICTGSSETCQSGYSCATTLFVTTPSSGSATSTLTRGCSPNNQCNITGSLTFTGGRVAISTACCNTDNCASAIPSVPTVNSTLNNLRCFTCASSDNCSSSNTLQCTGLETQCGRLSTSTTGSVTSASTIRGCATPSVCNYLGNWNMTFVDYNISAAVTTYCSNGFSLLCNKCINFSGANCTGSLETCQSGYSCATSISVTTPSSGSPTSTLTRGCVPNNQCNITGSLTFTGGRVAIATACCDTDNCASAIPSVPAVNSTSNSLICSTCASSNYCSSSNTLQCSGLETQCGVMSTSLTGSSTSTIRGCATPSVCNYLGNQNVTYGDQNINAVVTTYCSNGGFNLQSSFYLPAFLAFFLFKFLF
ncbi:uncharacterized protein [Aquarana catesbeiana]|uniref:uncharacterized protein n=1 Tax=Aquarana catesbeiana TaxID=8400 RepID=UPI003CCA1628